MSFQKPKGTEDFYPEEEAIKQALFNKFRQTANKFGFQEVSTPAFEDFKLLSQKEGDEIREQIFTLEKRGSEDLALRFDLTVPNARLVMQKQKELQKPIKWITCDRMWRYERPQKGRLREFYQMDMEIFGSQNSEADAEVISAAIDFLKSLDLTQDDFAVRLNNRKLLQGILTEFIKPELLEDLIRLIDKREKMEPSEWKLAVQELGVADVDDLLQVLDMKTLQELESIDKNSLAQVGFLELQEVYHLVDQEIVHIDLNTARGLSYYTSTVFEFFDKKGKYRALCGGGRYDKLIENFGGMPTPATGFAIGLSVLRLVLEERGKLPKLSNNSVEYYLAPLAKECMQLTMQLAKKLRENHSVEVDLMRRSFTKQMDYAKAIGAKKFIALGKDELQTKKAKVKNLQTGEEENIEL